MLIVFVIYIGEFTTFDFIPGIPAPFNFALAILFNQKMLTFIEKLQIVPTLLPMLIEGQSFIDAQDELSVNEFMIKYGMPSRVSDEIFVAMAKALDFIDPEYLSMTVVLTAMNRFINEPDGSQVAFLDGNQPDRLCQPLVEYIQSRSGIIRINSPVKEIITTNNEIHSPVDYITLRNGEIIKADEYISAMPVDIMNKFIPRAWSLSPFFRQIEQLQGIPVINIQLWFNKRINSVDQLCFSRSSLLSVYADMSNTCKEYYNNNQSMLELVFAPCSIQAGSNINWISKNDNEIINATMEELARLFPHDISARGNSIEMDGSKAQLVKSSVVRVPRSVYSAVPGRNKYRPSQRTPVPNFSLAGDYTYQKFLGSMEGAVLAGKLAAEVVVARLNGVPENELPSIRPVDDSILAGSPSWVPKDPPGVLGTGAIAFGGGAAMSSVVA